MKKLSYFVVILFLVSVSADAQNRRFQLKGIDKQAPQNISMFLSQSPQSIPLQKTTSTTGERLIGQSGYWVQTDLATGGYNYLNTDTGYYGYSGNRSSHFDYNMMSYSGYFVSSSDHAFGFGLNPTPAIYNKNNRQTILADETYQHDFTYSGPPSDFIGRTQMTYDAGNNVTFRFDTSLSSWYFLAPYLYTDYDTDGDAVDVYNNRTAIDSYSHRTFTYDAAKRLLIDSTKEYTTGGWQPTSKFSYYYDAHNNITELKNYSYAVGDWKLEKIYVLKYYPNDKVEKVTSTIYYSPSDSTVQIDSFGWNAGYDFLTYHEQRGPDISYMHIERKTISPTTQLPDTVFKYTQNPLTGSITFNTIDVFTYDAYHEPIRKETYRLSVATGHYDTLDNIRNFYYETFNNTKVGNSAMAKSQMVIFPNPTSGDLSIQFNGLSNNAQMHLRLVNMLGQAVIEKEIDNPNTEQLSLVNIPTGVYRLVAEDGFNTCYIQSINYKTVTN